FADAPAVLVREYGTERKAAWWVLAPDDDGPLERLGPEPDSDEFAELVLDDDQRAALLDAVRAVMRQGLERERGRAGGLSQPKLGEHFEVHARYGSPC